jgi:hypothetical protein
MSKLLETEAHSPAADPFIEMLLFDLIEPVKPVADRLSRMQRFAENGRQP